MQETKTLTSAAAQAANEYRFKALVRVAGEPAVLAHAHRWEPFFKIDIIYFFKILLKNGMYSLLITLRQR